MRTGTIAVCSLALLCVATALPFEGDKWEHFKRTFGKSYSPSEEEYRQKVFLSNVQYIEKHNALFKKGEKTFDLAVNKFADMTNEEFRRLMNGYKMRQTRNPDVEVYEAPEGEQLPSSVDWRKKGAVTPVKNQAQCGSCWAFSTTGSLEGQWFLKKGKLVSLSEQNLMDCSYDEGNESCNGGLMDQGFEYIKKNKGIDTEASYPYEAEDDTCRFNKKNVGATLSSYTDVKANSESSLQSAIANVGPISVAIDAGEMSFQFYNSGVYYEEECSPNELDHGVLAVGYGTDKKNDYYIVKNSWGEDWGQEGYILMARNKQNNCGIATQASYPNV